MEQRLLRGAPQGWRFNRLLSAPARKMDPCCCLICNKQFNRIFDIKMHLSSGRHHGRKSEIFKKDILKASGLLPFIVVFRVSRNTPFVGLSMLTFCCSMEENDSFYLCHVCGEKCPPNFIATHVVSKSHYSNYLNYTDPDSLNFAWTPSVDAHKGKICASKIRQIFANGSGQLQVLDLPADLMKELKPRLYSEVMQSLNENEELLTLMQGSTPNRVTIQTYLKDGQRKHPLLGLQHLIECICTGNPTKAYYLCTLCKLSLPSLMIIKHVLSFDHIHAYFKVQHPSTLLSKECYQGYSTTFSSQMLNFAKQSEEINPTLNTDMKQVIMKPDVFASVNFASYAEALRMLHSITSDGKKSSLIPVVKPGKRLVLQDTLAAPATSAASADSAMPETPAAPAPSAMPAHAGSPDSTGPAAAGSSAACPAPAKLPVSAEPLQKPRASEACKGPAPVDAESALSHDIRCQNCSTSFITTQDYCKHLASTEHKNMLEQYFNKIHGANNGPEPKEWTQRIGLFLHLNKGLRTNTPVVGVPLIVSCISTEADVKPFYLCFACKECFNESRLTRHLNSTKHLVHVLLYHNPWRLPFAWEKDLDVTLLRLTAMEEEKERGPDLMLMKILDVPYRIFFKFCHSYEKVMRVLQLYHALLMHAVPRRETYRKLNNNHRFPLLGQEFLVMHHMSELQYEDTKVEFLCLLCERILSNEESHAHVFSREHVTTFLERFHPGTLNSDSASQLLDLARQAAQIHPVSHLQVIRGEWPIGKPYTYQNAKSVLISLKYKEGRGHLLPQIVPKKKLVPRIITEPVDQKGCLKNSQNGPEMQPCQKHLHCSDAENITNRPSGEIPTSSANDPKNGKGLTSQSRSEQAKNECSDTLQGIKEEMTEVSIKQERAEIALESFPNVARDIEVEAEVKRIGAESESRGNLVGTTHRRLSSEENVAEVYRTEQHFRLKQEPPCEELLTLTSIKNEKKNIDKATSPQPSQWALIDTGMSKSDDQAEQNTYAEFNPPSAPPAVQPMANLEVVDMEIESDTEVQHSAGNESAVAANESTSNTPDISKAPASTSDIHLSYFQSDKEQLTLIDLTNSTRVKHDSKGNGSNANVIQNPAAAHRAPAACRMLGPSHSEKNANCDVTTSSMCATVGPTCRFRRPSCSEETAKSKACSSPQSSSSSSTSTVIQKSKETWCKLAATTTKRPATSSDSSRCSKISKSSESAVKSQTRCLPSASMASVEHGGTETSPGPLRDVVQANTDISSACTSEAPHSTSQVSIESKRTNPANQPSCDSVSKPTKRAPEVGLNQLIVVSCQSKRQVYCELCSVKLSCSGHVRQDGHKHNYVKKFFGVTDKLPPDVLDKVVSSLSEVERNLGSHTCQRLTVNMDTYKELRDLPASEALATVKKMLPPKDSRVFPGVTQISPVGFHSPDEEMEPALKQDTSKAVDQADRDTVTSGSETVESAGQLSPRPTSSRNGGTGPTGVPDAEAAGQKMDAHQDGQNRPDRRWQLGRSTGDLQVKEILSGFTDMSFGKVSTQDSPSATSGITEQQNHQRTDCTSKPVSESSVKNKGVSVAKAHSLSRISIGERIHASSNLSVLLMVHQTPIVGLSSIWECRGISSGQLPSFFLCESCVERLSIEQICNHMNSTLHQLAYLTEHYPRDMLFWGEKDLSHTAKLSGLKDVVSLLSKHESYAKMDAQVVLLREDLYKCIQAAPVSKALKLVQSMTRGTNPELSKALHEYVEKHLMDEDKPGGMLGPMTVASVSRKTDAVVSSIVGANASPAPQEIVKKLSLEPESEATVSLHQKSVPESPSSSVGPQKSATPSPTDESLESPVTPHNIRAQPDSSVPQSETQPSTGSVFESQQTSHASTSTLLSSNNKDRPPTQNVFSVHQAECMNLISLIKNLKHAGENTSSQKSAEMSCVQPPSQVKVGRWDSEKKKVPVKPVLLSAPSVAPMENQCVDYVAPPEALVPYSVSNDTNGNQPGKIVHCESTDKNESQVTSSLGVEGKHISVQISRSAADTDSRAVCPRPLNYTEVDWARPLAPAPESYGRCTQPVNDTHRQVSSSAEAASAAPGGNALGVFHVNQVIAGLEAHGSGHLGTQTPPGGIGLEVQQQQMQQQMQQILQLLHQQQIMQQQLQSQIQQQQQMHQFQMQQPQTYQVHQYQMYQQQSNGEPVQQQQQQQMQMQQQMQQLIHQYQMYQQQSNGEPVQQQQQQQQQMQPLIHQYQMYPNQMQQQMNASAMYQLQQRNQDQVWQQYGQYCTGTSVAPNQSSLPLPARANVEYNIHSISLAQHDNLLMQNIAPTGHVGHYSSFSANPQYPGS